MKKVLRIMAVVMALMLVGAVFASCGGSATDSKAEGDNAETQAKAENAEQTPDFSNPEIKLSFGDYEGMETLMVEASEGKYDGKVVQIDGISAKYGSSYSVMERDEDAGASVGMTYKIKDAGDDGYPADDARVVITGVIAEGEYGARFIEVLPENVVVSE